MNEDLYEQILARNRAEAAARRAQEQRETSPSIAEETEMAEAPPSVDNTSMLDFAASHRQAKLPSIRRRHQLIERERIALGGEPRREDF